MKLDLRRRRKGRPNAYIPGASTTPPVVTQATLAIEHRHVEPGVVGAKAGGPDDRADLATLEIETQRGRFGNSDRLETTALRRRLHVAVVARPFVERVEQSLELEVGERARVAE